MPLITAHDKRLFFAHVPKAGGSSVEDYLLRRFGGPLSLRFNRERAGARHRGLVVPPVHFSAADLDEVLPHDIDHSFTVVRDPLKRMQSQYRFQSKSSKTRNFGFSTWLRIMLHAARFDPRVYANHIRPQSDLVPKTCEVFHLEDGFVDMIAWLDEITASPAPDVTMDHLNQRASEPIAMSREDVKLITEFYRPDYERFSYALPDLSDYAAAQPAPWRGPVSAFLARGVVYKQHRRWVS